MTIKRIEQDKTSRKKKILDELMLVMGISGLGQMDIAAKLGYSKDVFSQMKSGYSEGSEQLLAGLLLLKELTVLRTSQKSAAPDLLGKLDLMDKEIQEMRKNLQRYPEHQPQVFGMNERPTVELIAQVAGELAMEINSDLPAEEVRAKIVAIVRRRAAELARKTPPPE